MYKLALVALSDDVTIRESPLIEEIETKSFTPSWKLNMPVIYKPLAEVRVLHEYYLTIVMAVLF